MKLQFPSAPTNGQLWVCNNVEYKYNSVGNKWNQNGLVTEYDADWLEEIDYVADTKIKYSVDGRYYIALQDSSGVTPGTDELIWDIVPEEVPPIGEADVTTMIDTAVEELDDRILEDAADIDNLSTADHGRIVSFYSKPDDNLVFLMNKGEFSDKAGTIADINIIPDGTVAETEDTKFGTPVFKRPDPSTNEFRVTNFEAVLKKIAEAGWNYEFKFWIKLPAIGTASSGSPKLFVIEDSSRNEFLTLNISPSTGSVTLINGPFGANRGGSFDTALYGTWVEVMVACKRYPTGTPNMGGDFYEHTVYFNGSQVTWDWCSPENVPASTYFDAAQWELRLGNEVYIDTYYYGGLFDDIQLRVGDAHDRNDPHPFAVATAITAGVPKKYIISDKQVQNIFEAYKADKTYILGEQVISLTNGWLYESLVADNKGNAVTDNTKWKCLSRRDYIISDALPTEGLYDGLLVFNTTDRQLCLYDGANTTWIQI